MSKKVDMPFIIVSFCLVGMLGLVWKLYTSKEEAVDAFSSLQARFMAEKRLEVGDYVPALGVSDRSGQKHLLEVVGRPRLTLLVSSECAGCFSQLENYWPLISTLALPASARGWGWVATFCFGTRKLCDSKLIY